MAFYHQAPGKKKKVSYGELGSWDEEGSHYRDSRNKSKPERKYSGKKRAERPEAQGRANPKKDSFRKDPRGERNMDDAHKAEADFRDYEYRGKTDARLSAASAEPENILCGRNPIREALKNDRDIEKLLVQKGELSGTAREIIAMAREKKVMVQEVEKSRLDEITQHHQGLIAYVSAYQYAEVEDILQLARDRGEAPFIILLDSVTDPHNLGAIIRTAECTGAHGVIVPMHRSVGLTPAAVKASAGAVEHVPVARVTNLNRTIDELKSRGIWVYAVTMNARSYEDVDFHDGTALVIGAEGEGISRLTLEKCDMAVSLPMKGSLDSLNASVAAGVMMYRVLSCRK